MAGPVGSMCGEGGGSLIEHCTARELEAEPGVSNVGRGGEMWIVSQLQGSMESVTTSAKCGQGGGGGGGGAFKV
ncbi:unnamed protein product [Dicrocoelium dendriticum]|nr:unnamed protein product [Dicrocoelium dendriticum]CAH8659819.1 unnamed protein product [Dicrocoelium dendriticum]